ncbi:Adenylate isopentenyltransferase [Quillaja saponaria]|uniref:Adenylate isopentenyltransferase n=1 Tax=Quillaja saponaria TaxID=32244 RepID=A0AAD7LB32_QUISA|nr:Adenylate isopentenyltransferase [Quillaja saponaria]
MDSTSSSAYHRHRRKDKVVVIMGATGTGKSKLSVDLATLFPFSEIINSDKMQVYRGLDITTNKIPIEERLGVPHHLLGEVDPVNGEFTPSDFRSRGGSIISDITSRRKLPLVVGGSNSFIHALLVDQFDTESDVFDGSSSTSISSELRYNCCFLWVDVSFPVLSDYLSKRVEDMLDLGMVDELAEFYDPEAKDLEDDSAHRTGLRKAIGVPEFDRYFRKYPPARGLLSAAMVEGTDPKGEDNHLRKGAYEEAVTAIKDNTCQLVKRQIGKIFKLKRSGWDLRRIDATEAFRAAVTSESGGSNKKRWSEIWERQVVEPSVKIVKRFLKE